MNIILEGMAIFVDEKPQTRTIIISLTLLFLLQQEWLAMILVSATARHMGNLAIKTTIKSQDSQCRSILTNKPHKHLNFQPSHLPNQTTDKPDLELTMVANFVVNPTHQLISMRQCL